MAMRGPLVPVSAAERISILISYFRNGPVDRNGSALQTEMARGTRNFGEQCHEHWRARQACRPRPGDESPKAAPAECLMAYRV